MTDASGIAGIVVAAIGGCAVGIERQRSGHASGSQARFGGVRTFTLLGSVAGLAGWLATQQLVGVALVLVASASALVIAGYVAASRRDVEATTEAAALVVIGAGFAAGFGLMALGSGIIAISTLLLVEKSALHGLVGRIDDEELRAGARFGVMAVVVLPLLPEGPFGPFGGIKPQELWLLVLFFTGLSFIGYFARRAFGADRGYPLAGLLAGMVSSTNATLTFARQSRREPELSYPLATGAVGASTMLFPRVLLATLVLNASVARAVLPYLAFPFAVGLVVLGVSWRKHRSTELVAQSSNPLQLGPALVMAVTFQAVLIAVDLVRRQFGDGGLAASGAVLGLTDVDALTVSMAKSASAGVSPRVAAQAIAVGVFVNCLMKTGLAVVLGTPPFRRLAGATLAAMAVVAAVAITVGAIR
jgi:uncharacterized membrane protein (DUF4010 family)